MASTELEGLGLERKEDIRWQGASHIMWDLEEHGKDFGFLL